MWKQLTALATATIAICAVAPMPQAQEQEQQQGIVDLSEWDYAALRGGWSADELLNEVKVFSREGEEVADVDNIIINSDGKINALLVETEGLRGTTGTHLRVPWNDVDYKAGERMAITASEEAINDYTLFGPERLVQTGAREWYVTDLIGDVVILLDGTAHGMIDDVIFSPEGQLQAIVVEQAFEGKFYAYPFQGLAYGVYGFAYGWDPGLNYYELPYTPKQLTALEPFSYEALAGSSQDGAAAGDDT